MSDSDIPKPVADALAAANAHDTDAFLAVFAPEGVVDDWGREFRGPESIRRWSDAEFIGVSVTLAVTGVTDSDGEIVVHAQVGGNGFNGPSDFSFAHDGRMLTRMTIRG